MSNAKHDARLTAEQFETAAERTRLAPHTRKMARSFLVDGVKQIEIANAFQVSRQLVGNSVASVLREHNRAEGIAENWVTITVTVPPKKVAAVRRIETAARKAAGV